MANATFTEQWTFYRNHTLAAGSSITATAGDSDPNSNGSTPGTCRLYWRTVHEDPRPANANITDCVAGVADYNNGLYNLPKTCMVRAHSFIFANRASNVHVLDQDLQFTESTQACYDAYYANQTSLLKYC
jgi:hypothetical protein